MAGIEREAFAEYNPAEKTDQFSGGRGFCSSRRSHRELFSSRPPNPLAQSHTHLFYWSIAIRESESPAEPCYEIHLSNEISPLETKWTNKASVEA
jgi:hypothetical protein